MEQKLIKTKNSAITTKEEDYAQWYLDVIEAADLAEHSPVKGCMTIKPYGYAIWENIQKVLNDKFKAVGVENAYFPLFIPESFLQKEKKHVEGFAPEVAVVTHAGGKKLEEALIVRPTSETIIGDALSRWITSYRDLPIIINQWANVVRWELRTRFFLRTSEFLWQEGHTAHATKQEALDRTEQMLGIYKSFVEDYLAISPVAGRKSESERFAGADDTYTLEAMMQDGKALQSGTSHFLGQNFAKAFNIQFSDENNQLQYAWQTSWGLSTRIIGALIMTHSDDNGLVLPPRIAPISVVIIPIVKENDKENKEVLTQAEKIKEQLQAVPNMHDIKIDTRDMRVGEKFFAWEKKGVPVRIEIGIKDMQNNTVVIYRRDTKEKVTVEGSQLINTVKKILSAMQEDLLAISKQRRESNTISVSSYDAFRKVFEKDNKFVYIPWCERTACEEKVKEETKATTRCIPFDQEEDELSCVICGKSAKRKVIFAKAY